MKLLIVRVALAALACSILCTCTSIPQSSESWAHDQPGDTQRAESPQAILTPSGNQLSEDIAYLSDRSGIFEVWLLDAVSGVGRQITTTSCSDGRESRSSFKAGVQFFSWAPNGQRIAYLTACSFYGQARIYVIDLKSNVITLLSEADRYSSYPSWSPDSRYLVFARGVPGFSEANEYGIYLSDLFTLSDENKAKRVTSDEACFGGCLDAIWSSDNHIAYQGPYIRPATAWRAYVSITSFARPSVTLQSLKPLVSFGPHDISPHGLAWSPDGQLLAIATVHGYTDAYLTVVSISDLGRPKLHLKESRDHQPNSFGPGFYTPLFSPDNTALYFVARPISTDSDTQEPFGVAYRVSITSIEATTSTKDIQTVSQDGQLVGFPSLSHDGKWLAYTVLAGQSSEVWLQTSDGQFRQRLIGDRYLNTQPAWRPPSD